MLAPIVFGKLIDDICIQWENGEDSCTGRGACRLYDNDVFRWKLIGYQALFRFVGLVFTFSSLVIAVVTKKFDSVETENLNTLDAFEQVTRPFKTADKATDITNFPV
nr:hypothetical protein BaRGS_003729 [Batillaria attramentaria]